ncbi:hypothetical protein BJ508DRAFT_327306 [Ascobolus immersus RN42]|uniref:BZIP domain-containing protein n=1 Tax=Ascobolus immersus RN42 TaxID=1160509 RepID=A0A3N4I8E4_ASCIM|nr:hypothetical protein BJ508DRAFT_327306 [Ascobolus immersus RN42]
MAAVLQARAEQHHLNNAMESREGDKNLSRPSSVVNNTKSTTVTTNSEKPAPKATSVPPLNPDHGPPPPPPAVETPGGANDYFSYNNRFAEEPNPFEQSFAHGETTPKAILPPVASIASPAPLGPGTGNSSVFNWPNSLRSGPLSPAMLQGPAVNTSMPPSGPLGFDQHLRTGLTPNESGIRSGLTPGGGGFFPTSSPASQLFQQFVTPGVSTPGTMEFKKTAMSAAAKKSGFTASTSPQMEKTTLPDVSSISNDLANKSRRASLIDNMHDPGQTAAANGLYLLAQQTHTQPDNQYGNGTIMPAQSLAPSSLMTETSGMHKPPLITNMPGGPTLGRMSNNTRGISEMSEDMSDSGSENAGSTSGRGRGKRGASAAGSRRKTSDDSGKARKRSKVSGDGSDDEMGDDDKNQQNGEKSNKKMTDEEKRKNFLERNRVAALKCRQRKKQWLASLQKKVEIYTSENDALSAQVTSLREELVALKTLLLAHKDCPGFPQNLNLDAITGLSTMQLPDYVTHGGYQMNPNVMAQQPGARRFS